MAYVKKSYNNYKKPVVVTKERVKRNWSQFQQAIFNDIAYGNGHTQVIARAGSGKTSTIVEGFYYIPSNKKALMVAFNKSIKMELSARAPQSVEVSTLHALGYKVCRSTFAGIGSPDSEKTPNYIKSLVGDENNYELRTSLSKTVSLAKGCLAHSYDQIDQLIDAYGIDTVDEKRDRFISLVMQVMDLCRKDISRIDFDDMIWFCIVHNLKMPKYDFVFIDEAQDLNTSQIRLALSCCKNDGRIISVGDPRQAIYAFRGADVCAIDNIVSELNAKTLPLSVTYRCTKSIVEMAKQIVPDLEAAHDAEEGSVQNIDENYMENNVKPGDFILSRTNAPLIGWCLTLLKNKTPANIQGKDLGKNLLSMVKKSKCKNIPDFIEYVQKWCEAESQRLITLKRDPSVTHDKAECLYTLCEEAISINDVINNIEKLFHDGDDKDRVILSTTHKAKGLERNNVFVLSKTYRIGKSEEEDNLAYVAWTRAKQNLYLVK